MPIDSTSDGKGGTWRTPARKALAVFTFLAVATGGAVVTLRSEGNYYANTDNPAAVAQFTDNQHDSAATIDALATGTYGPFHSNDFTETTGTADNGPHPQGQFRILCGPSHFGRDDPIIKAEQPGESHLHMFFGNTAANAYAKADVPVIDPSNDLFENGGSTCQAGALNRSAYWVPAMLSGPPDANRKLVLPTAITIYYKSHRPTEVQILPRGIQLLVGNINPGGTVNSSFTHGERLSWGCYNGSTSTAQTNTIPGTNGTTACPAGQDIQATIQFPQCIETDDGQSTGNPVLTDPDFVSHTHMLYDVGGNFGLQNDPCPASHPYRVPQISFLIRYPNLGTSEVAKWRLSSDTGVDNPTGSVPNPGGSLHGDWLGGWHPDAIQAWIDGCFDPGGSNSRNCSLGQTGQNGTGRKFKPITGTGWTNQVYTGPYLIDDPAQ